MCSFWRFVIALGIVGACGHGEQQRAEANPGATGQSASAATTNQPLSKAACPANGAWSECSVFDRLDHAGLAPRRDSSTGKITLPPLTVAGARYLLGSAELEVFIYPDASARQHDEARLDRTKYIEETDEPTLRGEATLIRNANLLAILKSRNDHQRERVSDALSAGPPQGSGSARLPSTTIPR
jgi:hypothetical protein